jgi:putative membrane protein
MTASPAAFLGWFAAAAALLGVHVAIYLRLTPYHEFRLVREGNVAAAIALVGVVGGFTLPVASAVIHGSGLVDMLLWSALALGVQSLLYIVLSRLLPELPRGIAAGQVAHGITLGGFSVCAGVLNAAAMTW